MKYYCEIGANNGVDQSRSLHFEDDGDYIGLLIEPDIKSYNELLKNRKVKNIFVNMACSSFENGEYISDFFNNGLMSGLPGSYDYHNSFGRISKVKVKPLQSILDVFCIKELEHLFLDVEGKELDVLKGIDFQKTKVKNLEVEIHFEDDRQKIIDLLTANGMSLNSEITNDGLPKILFIG